MLFSFSQLAVCMKETASVSVLQIHQRSAERLRDLCYRNGGVFVKVGQHIGSLDYLLPPEYVKTMKIFHTDAPRSDLSDLFRVVEEDLGQKACFLWPFQAFYLFFICLSSMSSKYAVLI